MQESVNEQRPDKIFADAKEVEITRAIAKEFYGVLQDRAESDVIVIGATCRTNCITRIIINGLQSFSY